MFFFKYDGFILNMVIISDMDTQHNIWYLPSESNHVMSTNEKLKLKRTMFIQSRCVIIYTTIQKFGVSNCT